MPNYKVNFETTREVEADNPVVAAEEAAEEMGLDLDDWNFNVTEEGNSKVVLSEDTYEEAKAELEGIGDEDEAEDEEADEEDGDDEE